jgi:hypothetical protein
MACPLGPFIGFLCSIIPFILPNSDIDYTKAYVNMYQLCIFVLEKM